MIRKHVVSAIFKRNFVSYFSSPTGYVFITVFIMGCGATAFWPPAFFTNNLANLQTLNQFFPFLLLFFVPAVAMALWAEERKQGTEELLLTLPARDLELVLGKYLAALGIYSVALLFSLSFVVVLAILGRPDIGVMLGTYAGYWFLGAALLAVATVASLLTSSMTVAFILGMLFCVVPVFLGHATVFGHGKLVRWLVSLGVTEPFEDFAKGVLSIQAVVYFAALTAVFLYLNLMLLARRHVQDRLLWLHYTARLGCLVVAGVCLGVLVGRLGWRADLTAERIHSLTPQTLEVLRKIDPSRPVYIQAFVSPEVPTSYVQTRENLLALLREYDAIGGDRVNLRIVSTKRYTAEAHEAEEKGIRRERVREAAETRRTEGGIYLGLVVACGADEVVLPFLHRGVPVEYELTRSIGVVSGVKRKKVGIASSDVKMFGGFDFEAMSQQPVWSIVEELRKQYEVSQVSLDAEVKDVYDCLVVAMPSSLPQPQMDNLLAYVRKGHGVLLLDDPLPLVNPSLAPREPRRGPSPRGMFAPPPPQEPKGQIGRFMEAIGIDWPDDSVVWQAYNPYPKFQALPKEFAFVGAANERVFNPDDPISSGLQEMVLLCAGHVRPRGAAASLTFTPLLTTALPSGQLPASEILQRSFFGFGDWNPRRIHRVYPGPLHLAARVKGTLPAEPPKGDGKDAAPPPPPAEINVVMVADLDFVSEQFFRFRRDPELLGEDVNFDNISFLLNCVDVLAGDESYVAIRKRRPRHRTLELVEKLTKRHEDRQVEETRAAEEAAKDQLKEAEDRLKKKVEELRQRKDLDRQTLEIMVANLEEVENRRLEVTRANIDAEKEQKIERSKNEKELAVQAVEGKIRVFSILLPPALPLLIALFVFLTRSGRETQARAVPEPAPERRSP